jgi:lipoprotein-anchoring transpeptidase ErfK/SrfK
MPHSVFFRGGYAIHGTGYIKRLGRRASHGCVRLHPKNAARLYRLVLTYGFDNTRIRIHW